MTKRGSREASVPAKSKADPSKTLPQAQSQLPPLRLLLIEDDESDAWLFRFAFERCCPKGRLSIYDDGRTAIDCLQLNNEVGAGPDLFVTDLKMPLVSGFEFLRWRKQHSVYSLVPVVVLSASFFPQDVQKAYELGANAFLCKPHALEESNLLVGSLCAFWSLVPRAR